ncbi:MAG: type II toxin-antitoxin system HicA family toxin [Candidatus Riflebacteria bacterium HGW-Riflebacteria-1]|jgi:predicted RNA binding protein YcfA (HicA-like mRNA interferase family)|nr:MAG: type II toxin-antitoxin system HicA family toxin [Candidatus Riflebacteria bacterium HGW-Riflebacteria-1]
MTKLPRLTAAELIKFLNKNGYNLNRQEGSHKIFRHPVYGRATVPDHAGKTIHPKIIKEIMVSMGLTLEKFLSLL